MSSMQLMSMRSSRDSTLRYALGLSLGCMWLIVGLAALSWAIGGRVWGISRDPTAGGSESMSTRAYTDMGTIEPPVIEENATDNKAAVL